MRRALFALIVLALAAVVTWSLLPPPTSLADTPPNNEDPQQVTAEVEAPADAKPATAHRDVIDAEPSDADEPPISLTGILVLDGPPIQDAELCAFRGHRDDRKLDFASLLDEAGRDKGASFKLDTPGDPIATTPVTTDGAFELRIPPDHGRDFRLTLAHRFYGLVGVLPVHVPESMQRVELGGIETVFGGHVVGRVIGDGTAHAANRGEVRLVMDADPMAVLQNPNGFISQITQGGNLTAPLDADGRFEFYAVSPSPSIRAFAEGNELLARSEQFSIRAGETREILLEPIPTAEIEVAVTIADGSPLHRASVRVTPTDTGGELSRALLTKHSTTREDGTATLRGLPAGDYRAIADHPEHRSAHTEFALQPGASTRVELQLNPGGVIRGRVVDTDGNPIAGAGVATAPILEIPMFGESADLVGDDIFARAAQHSDHRTDDAGRFELRGVPLDSRFAVFRPRAQAAAAM